MSNEIQKKEYEQLNISVAIFLLYSLNKDLTEIWDKKWKYSKDWEEQFFNKLNSIPPEEVEEKYNNFLDIFAGDSSIVFDLKRNRFTDYGSKNKDIRDLKERYSNQEDQRINEYNKKTGKDIKNNRKINALIYPLDLSFVKIKVDDYGMEFELAENILFDNKMYGFLDKIKEVKSISELRNVSIIKNNSKMIESEDKPYSEYFNENKNISFKEYSDRYKKSYFFKKNGVEALKSLYEANVIITSDGSSIIPMSNINNFNNFNCENINSYQNIKNIGDNNFFKLFNGSSSNCFIKLNKQNPANNQTKRVFVGEGMATCLSIQKMINNSSDVICAFNADNLVKVVKELSDKYGDKVEIIVCCDKDKPKIKYNNYDSYYPSEVNIGKGFLILKDIINLIGENKVKFTYPEFNNKIDNTSIILHLSKEYQKLCYSNDFGRSDFNDGNLNLTNSINNLNNPEYLNEENLSKINFSTVVIDKDNNEKIVECKSIDMVNNFKKIVLESLMKNLNDDKNFKRDFIKTYGEEGINKLATLANNLGASNNFDYRTIDVSSLNELVK